MQHIIFRVAHISTKRSASRPSLAFTTVRQFAAAAIAHNCSQTKLRINRSDVLLEFAKTRRLRPDTLAHYCSTLTEHDDRINLIKACNYVKDTRTTGWLKQQAHDEEPYIAQLAIEALTALKIPATDYDFLLSTNHGEILTATLHWIAATDSAAALRILFNRLGDAKLRDEAVIGLLTRFRPDKTQKAELHKLLKGTSDERAIAAKAIGATGDFKQVNGLINDPIIRSGAISYFLLNPLAGKPSDSLPFKTAFPDFSTEAIRSQLKDAAWVKRILDKVPPRLSSLDRRPDPPRPPGQSRPGALCAARNRCPRTRIAMDHRR